MTEGTRQGSPPLNPHFEMKISFVKMTGNFNHARVVILQFTMNCTAILCVAVMVSMASSLKLNQQRPSTVWGVQKKLFRHDLEKEYYKSKDGTYHFTYDTGGGRTQMFRKERRFADGTVSGFFGYIDPDGILRITEYEAGRNGYRQRTVLRSPVPILDE